MKEIERKWLVNGSSIPTEIITAKEIYLIEQHYVVARRDEEVRIRRAVDMFSGATRYTITFKSDLGLVREEYEVEISKETWHYLYKKTGGKPLRKMRMHCNISDALAFIINRYINELGDSHIGDNVIVEVEFASEEEANAFMPPEWFDREVTSDSRYSNRALWESIQ